MRGSDPISLKHRMLRASASALVPDTIPEKARVKHEGASLGEAAGLIHLLAFERAPSAFREE